LVFWKFLPYKKSIYIYKQGHDYFFSILLTPVHCPILCPIDTCPVVGLLLLIVVFNASSFLIPVCCHLSRWLHTSVHVCCLFVYVRSLCLLIAVFNASSFLIPVCCHLSCWLLTSVHACCLFVYVRSLCLCSFVLSLFASSLFCFPFFSHFFFSHFLCSLRSLFLSFALAFWTFGLCCICFFFFRLCVHCQFSFFSFLWTKVLRTCVSFAWFWFTLLLFMPFCSFWCLQLFLFCFFLNRFACICSFWPLCSFACMSSKVSNEKGQIAFCCSSRPEDETH